MFTEGPDFAERIREFRRDRVARVARQPAIQFHSLGQVLVHVVPVPAFADGRLTDVVDAAAQGTHMPLPLGPQSGRNRMAVSLDGLLNIRDAPGSVRGYAQLFRNGAIEGVTEMSAGEAFVRGRDVANMIVAGVRQYVDVLANLDAGEPLYAMVSLTGIRGVRMLDGSHFTGGTCPENVVMLPDVLLDPAVEVTDALRPALNVLWNAFGAHPCTMYGNDGLWTGTA
jgi:hypothetical protein